MPLHHQTAEPATTPLTIQLQHAGHTSVPPRVVPRPDYTTTGALRQTHNPSKSPSRVHPERSCKVPLVMVSCLSGPGQKQEPPNRRLLLTCPLIVLAALMTHTSPT